MNLDPFRRGPYEDFERLNWLDEAAREVDITIRHITNWEVRIGQVAIPGLTLREAIDSAIRATARGGRHPD